MPEASIRLTPTRVALVDLLLDPNNPRFATSLNLPSPVPDDQIPSSQQRVRDLFVGTESGFDSGSQEDDLDVPEGPVEVGDLVEKMKQVGFIPIDQIVVRRLEVDSEPAQYVVIEGNRRVRAAKFILEGQPESRPEKRAHHEFVLDTLRELDVLVLETQNLSAEQIDRQIGVILGLRHFGSVLGWGSLAKAVNIYNEYMATAPVQETFALDNRRVTAVEARLSVPRRDVRRALATYIAYRQLQESLPQGPRPRHYTLIQACVTNTKLAGSRFIEADPNTFELSPASIENLEKVCEFSIRDTTPGDFKILEDEKAVASLALLVNDAAAHKDEAVRAFAFSVQEEVLQKERPLGDAVSNLKTFKSERKWTESLRALLEKAEEELDASDFHPIGNDLLKLEAARRAFKNVRTLLQV